MLLHVPNLFSAHSEMGTRGSASLRCSGAYGTGVEK